VVELNACMCAPEGPTTRKVGTPSYCGGTACVLAPPRPFPLSHSLTDPWHGPACPRDGVRLPDHRMCI